MGSFAIFLIVLLWSIRILANILSYIYLWYVKEYRYDRMWIHLTKTKQGKQILLIPFKVPPISPKTICLTVFTGITIVYLFFFLKLSILIKYLILDLLTFPVLSVWVFIFNIPTYIYHELIIWLAIRKLKQHTWTEVIGITGSFGKTSTKEYLSTILSTKYKVLKTEDSKNSPVAIAELVLRKLQSNQQIFIVEMAAYKRGEIARMVNMVKPQIGIITAINAQHQDLFLSLDTTLKAKFELIQGLTKEKAAILNADNVYTQKIGKWASEETEHICWFTLKGRSESKPDSVISATNISVRLKNINFKMHYKDKTVTVTASVLGQHQVSNILAASAAAIFCGMSLDDISEAIKKIRPFTKTMEPVTGVNNSTFINDTFNNNPDAALAALDYLTKTSGKKILVFQPMIELGKYSPLAHQQVGAYAAKICDLIYLTNNNFYEDFMSGVNEIPSSVQVCVLSAKDISDQIKHQVRQGDTVIFKGKEAESVFKRLKP